MVAAALNGVVAQRLVKRVCTNCAQAMEATADQKAILKVPQDHPLMVNKGMGCETCSGGGYKGRIAVHEVLVMDRDLRALAIQGKSADEIKTVAIQKGLKTLAESCRELVIQGVTTVEELIRVAASVDS
jgi:type IV pilus assembly protein PilB